MYRHPGNRPINLNLKAFQFPLNAYVSILHRVTGALLIVSLILGLLWINVWILNPQDFQSNNQWFDGVFGQLFLWGLLSSLWYHWLAGARHLLIEHNFMGSLDSLALSTLTAKWMLIVFALGELVVIWGMWG